jgi:hypothetical protein
MISSVNTPSMHLSVICASFLVTCLTFVIVDASQGYIVQPSERSEPDFMAKFSVYHFIWIGAVVLLGLICCIYGTKKCCVG